MAFFASKSSKTRAVAFAIFAVAQFFTDACLAATVYPDPGLYDGPATVKSVSPGCNGFPTVGDTSQIKFEYPGQNAGTLKYWEPFPDSPPGIRKVILTVQTGKGSSSPAGSFTTYGFTQGQDRVEEIDGSFTIQLGYVDANSFTMVLSTYSYGAPFCIITYDIALTRTGGVPASP